MEIDSDKLVENAIRDAFREGLKEKFTRGYNTPLDKIITDGVAKHAPALQKLLEEGIASCMNDEKFREDIKAATRHSLAKLLIARFGGELEKQVNVLKSDPTTRARITLAIEEITKSKA